jgi:leucine dehydrogenase
MGLEGKSGNPSPVTAEGAFYGIKASLKYKFKDEDISKYTFAVQGVGQTGSSLIGFLKGENAKKIYFTDINPKNIEKIKKEFPDIEYVDPIKFYGLKVDVLVPCALGGVINSDTIPQIKASIIAGTANNVLLDEELHGPMLKEKGILYAPDFVINAGGLINVYNELEGYSREKVMIAIKLIGDRLLEIYKIADEQNIHTQLAAKLFAKKRIASIGTLHKNYIKR